MVPDLMVCAHSFLMYLPVAVKACGDRVLLTVHAAGWSEAAAVLDGHIQPHVDISFIICHHSIKMRTTLDIDSDVLGVAKSLAEARNISVGRALSYLARRGVTAQSPLSSRNGFCVFQVPEGAPNFGPTEIQAALDAEDLLAGREFLNPGKP